MASIKTGINYFIHNRMLFYDSVVRNYLGFLPDKIYLSLRYRCQMGNWMNWKNPKKFTEKIQWLKIYNRNPEYTIMVDKYAVKQYVAARIGEEYIIPTFGVWDRIEDIDWAILPNQFVLKTTHGGGGCGVVICSDKNTFDKQKAISKLDKSLKSDIYANSREWPYKNIKKRIIAEKYLFSKEHINAYSFIPDYKFFCFDGEPKFLYVSDSQNHKLAFLNTDWTRTEFSRDDYEPLEILPQKPQKLEEMLNIARKLSSGIPHVRVDLYNVDGHIYFGELTFYTGSGIIPFNPRKFDEKIGDLLILPTNSY